MVKNKNLRKNSGHKLKRHKNNCCANCKQDLPQENEKKSNTEREKNTMTVKNKS